MIITLVTAHLQESTLSIFNSQWQQLLQLPRNLLQQPNYQQQLVTPVPGIETAVLGLPSLALQMLLVEEALPLLLLPLKTKAGRREVLPNHHRTTFPVAAKVLLTTLKFPKMKHRKKRSDG